MKTQELWEKIGLIVLVTLCYLGCTLFVSQPTVFEISLLLVFSLAISMIVIELDPNSYLVWPLGIIIVIFSLIGLIRIFLEYTKSYLQLRTFEKMLVSMTSGMMISMLLVIMMVGFMIYRKRQIVNASDDSQEEEDAVS